MCGSYSTETEKLYNVVLHIEADKSKAEAIANAVSELTDFEYSVAVVEAA